MKPETWETRIRGQSGARGPGEMVPPCKLRDPCRTPMVVSFWIPKAFHRPRVVLRDPGTAVSWALLTRPLGLVWSQAHEEPVFRD